MEEVRKWQKEGKTSIGYKSEVNEIRDKSVWLTTEEREKETANRYLGHDRRGMRRSGTLMTQWKGYRTLPKAVRCML